MPSATPTQREALEYVRSTDGEATIADFVTHWEPIGDRLWSELVALELAEVDPATGRIRLTAAGRAELD